MKILVTGGAGFIGSALVRYLVTEVGAEVLNLDKLTYAGNLQSLYTVENCPNYSMVKVDICDYAKVSEIISNFRPIYIMHLAAETHVDRSITGANEFIQTNIIGTYNMLEATRKYWNELDEVNKANFRFLHVSTDEVYGSLGPDGLFDELTPYDPSSPYSASKASSDHLVKAWHRTYGIPVVVSNCSNNYGPYHFPEKLIPLNIINAIEGKPITVYGKGENIRDWLYVEDHARALYLICSKGRISETYNIGGNNEYKNIEIIEYICKIMDDFYPQNAPHSNLITFVTDRPGNDARYAINSTKIKTELGWEPKDNFYNCIKKTVKWYIDNEEWWRPLRNRIYNGERLGLIENSVNQTDNVK